MGSRYIIAAFIWAIVCAGSTQDVHIASEEPFQTSSNMTSTTVGNVDSSVTVIEQSGNTSLSQAEGVNKSEILTTTVPVLTTTKSVSCMESRKTEFYGCFNKLGENAMPYILNQKLPEFLDELCDANGSKPYMECMKRHFSDCPEFLNLPEVTVLQFGPYHIKDITYFSSIDQMCSCITGLACINELINVKKQYKLTLPTPESPWRKMLNFQAVCEYDTARYIGCVRGNLRVCQSPLTKRYGKDFTNDDADDIKAMYEFTKEHCSTVNSTGFAEKFSCLEKISASDVFRQCILDADVLSSGSKICKMRECVKELLEGHCDDDELMPLYIDAVNVYRRDSIRLLNKPCSSATDFGISVVTIIIAICIVILL